MRSSSVSVSFMDGMPQKYEGIYGNIYLNFSNALVTNARKTTNKSG